MNGDMNGTSEEPMETVDTSSAEPVGNSNDCKSIVTSSETNSVDNSDNLESKATQGKINNDSCSNEPELKDDCEDEIDKEVADHTQSTSSMTTCSNDNNISKRTENVKTPDETIHDHISALNDEQLIAKLQLYDKLLQECCEKGTINSDLESNDNDIIIVENENIVHEIPSDDEEVTNVKAESSVKLRRSTRTKKRKHYDDSATSDDDESDVEEVMVEDPLGSHTKTIVISNAKDLVVTAVQPEKSNRSRKNELSIPINSVTSGKALGTENKNSASSINSTVKSLYQAIFARGTTVTPIQSNNKPSSPIQQVSPESMQPPILPSLTDDMFVVEAPSFIVPYVYEKPSVKPFREFVDALGKSVDEQRIKDENENSLKEKKEKEKNEKLEIGETLLELEDKDKKENKKRNKERNRRRQNDDDDASWDGESSTDSDDETLSDNDDSVSLKEKTDSFASVKDIADVTIKAIPGKSESYFDCSLGNFFVNIGLNLVQEYVQNDLLIQQNRKLYREKKGGHSTKATELSILSLKKNLELSKENNAPFSLPQSKCDFCTFKSESVLVISHHLETPHMKQNLYKCNYCAFEVRSPHDILYHMEAEHKVRAKLERAPCYHQCPNCPFEDNGKGKLARHQIGCAKKFKPELNLAPPIEWEPPAKIPKITKTRSNVGNQYQNMLNRHMNAGNTLSKAQLSIPKLFPGGATLSVSPGNRSRMRPGAPPRFATVPGGLPILRPPSVVRHPASSNFPISNTGKKQGQPSVSITPLPRMPQPMPAPSRLPQPGSAKSTYVICEICDGYIKDLEQLRNHMQWIHKVKIHPKMIYNRPPLNCQKCLYRFFTDQGLERHLLGTHGLVTSSMQEAANKGKDAGRCPVCGRIYQWKLLNHVAKDHNLTLKPAHLSYKCTVCAGTFGTYKQFESHVYSAHSVVAKRVMDKGKATATASKPSSSLKPIKINDEITIIPQPATATSSKEK